MNKIMNFLKQRKKWVTIGVIVIVGIAGFLGYRAFSKPAMKQNGTAGSVKKMYTTVATKGDLTILANGSGVITPRVQSTIGTKQSGTLKELLFNVGDTVKAGDIVARIQTNTTEESVEASIASAKLALIKAQNTLSDLYTSAGTDKATALQDIETYSQDVRDAQYNINYLLVSNVESAKTAMEGVEQARQKYLDAWAKFEPYKYKNSEDAWRKNLLQTLDDRLSDYDSALTRLEYEYTLEYAQANLDKAKATYARYKDGQPDTEKVNEYEADVENAKASLSVAEQNQSVVDLVSPIDGTIIEVTGNIGEYVETNSVITIGDLTRPYIELYLDESDLDKAVVGYQVNVVFDAYPDETFTGKIVEVSPQLETTSNISTVVAKAELDNNSYGKPQVLPVGLNASVDVVGGEAKNVVLVPVEALRKLDSGEYGVFVVQNGKLTLRQVTVGLMDFTTAEIKSGLEAGEVVSTGYVEVQ